MQCVMTMLTNEEQTMSRGILLADVTAVRTSLPGEVGIDIHSPG
jgi:hypothetical protein